MTNFDILEGIDTFLFIKNTVFQYSFIREKIKKKEHQYILTVLRIDPSNVWKHDNNFR